MRMSLILRLVLVLFMASAAPAAAQDAAPPAPTTLPGMMIISDSNAQAIGPYLYVTRDPTQVLSYSNLVNGHLGTRRGTRSDREVVSLGSDGVPHWLIFSVRNNSTTQERWVISLGTRAEGRYGGFSRLFAYDHFGRHYLTYAMPDSAGNMPEPETLPLGGAGIPLTLAPGQQTLVALYLVPDAGGLTSIVPRIMAESAFMRRSTHLPSMQNVILFSLGISILFLLSFLILRGRWIALSAGFYLLAQTALYMLPESTLYSQSTLVAEIPLLLFSLTVILGFGLSRSYFRIGRDSRRETMIIGGAVLACVIFPLVGLIGARDDSLARLLLLGGTPLIGLCLLVFLTTAQAISGKAGGFPFAAGWWLLLVGAMITAMTFLGWLPQTAHLTGAYWGAAALHAYALAATIAYQAHLLDRLRRKHEKTAEEDAESVSMVRQARDSSENARLLRVIEHERQILQELRDRELQQNEEMRRAKEAADLANRAKSAFLAVISHEIRTPMSGIMGMVRLLQDTTLNKEQKDYARTIQDSCEAMLALLNDILDFEKIETGRMELEIVDFDLYRLINDILTLMSGHANQKRTLLKSDIDPATPRFMRGDPVRLRQILLNLTSNAIKFTDEGSVTLTVRPVSDDANQKQGWMRLYFSVRDSGIGISKEAQKNLFNPFSQADTSISRRYGGSGLGLAICQRLTEAMGGKIAIDSIENEGSTFFFSIVMETGSASGASTTDKKPALPPNPSSDKRKLSVLCVDDNEINRRLMQEFITRLGHTPTLADSGEGALEIVESSTPFDIILMDVQLPGISGMGATRAIRSLKDPVKAKTPVVALTGNVQDEDIRNCYAANMNGHLSKPLDFDRLKEELDKALSGNFDNPVSLESTNAAPPINTATLILEDDMQSDISGTPKPGISDDQPFLLPGDREDPADVFEDFEIIEDDNAPTQKGDDSQADNVPLIHSYAMDISDQDLEEDSFAHAIMIGELAAKEDEEDQKIQAPLPGTAIRTFDPSGLADLKTAMKPADLQDMIQSLIDKIEEIITSMNDAATRNDIATIRNRGHELKGMCGNFGLRDLSAAGGGIEKAAQDGEDIESLQARIATLPDLSRRAIFAIEDWMNA